MYAIKSTNRNVTHWAAGRGRHLTWVGSEFNARGFSSLESAARAYDRLADDNAEIVPKRCDYCEETAAEGYVQAYDAYVCLPCYEDHHGPIL